MATETCMDLADDMGIIRINVLHCLNCGEVVDPLILDHRERIPAPLIGRARVAAKTCLTGSGTPKHEVVVLPQRVAGLRPEAE